MLCVRFLKIVFAHVSCATVVCVICPNTSLKVFCFLYCDEYLCKVPIFLLAYRNLWYVKYFWWDKLMFTIQLCLNLYFARFIVVVRTLVI